MQLFCKRVPFVRKDRCIGCGAPPEFIEEWTNAQSDLARLSTLGREIAVGGDASDFLYDAPDVIVESVRKVLAGVRTRNQ
jgi:hypothetical protein